MIAEIVFSNSINGQTIYDYDSINPLLKQSNVSFGDQASYASLLQQIEKCYQKNGVVDIYNRESVKLSEESKQSVVDEMIDTKNEKENEYELLKQNVSNLIASDVKLLIMPYNVELAQRLFAFSINGSKLSKLDYDGVVFATGISSKVLSKDCWNQIVTELNLPQSEPFDACKQKIQESEEAKTNVSAPSISNILSNLISSDLRQLLINIGEPIIAEIVFSNSINGQSIYDYNSIDKFNAFSDHPSYESLLQKMETCYQKNGVVDIYNKESVKLSEESKQCVVDEMIGAKKKNEYELLKQNV